MKVVILSDIHGNFDALSALPEDYDQLWVLGDLVNYGPQPAEVVDFIRSHATHVVRGNHDHCIGFGEDPRCSPPFREMAEATRKYTDSILSDDDKRYLRSLPLQVDVRVNDARCKLCHAVPSDPLFAYCLPDSERWVEECRIAGADVLLTGHTHIPCDIHVENTLLVNPGSLGQPKSGAPRACYAVFEGRNFSLRSFAYPADKTAEKIRAMPIPAAIQEDLITVLRTGTAPEERNKGEYVENRGA